MTQPKNDNLVVRQHERVRCSLTAEAAIAPEHLGTITLTPLAGDNTGRFNASVCDISRGGVGLKTRVFLPKQARVSVTITDPSIGAPLSATVKVQRVIMTDRSPGYELGTSFVEPTPELTAAVAAAVSAINAAEKNANSGGTNRA